jgi:hypothetical protein
LKVEILLFSRDFREWMVQSTKSPLASSANPSLQTASPPAAFYKQEFSDTAVLCDRAIRFVTESKRSGRRGQSTEATSGDVTESEPRATGAVRSDGGDDVVHVPWALHLSLLKPHPPWVAASPWNEMQVDVFFDESSQHV